MESAKDIVGLDNPVFDDSLSIHEKASQCDSKDDDIREDVHFPKSEERILLWQFEEPAERYGEKMNPFKEIQLGLHQ